MECLARVNQLILHQEDCILIRLSRSSESGERIKQPLKYLKGHQQMSKSDRLTLHSYSPSAAYGTREGTSLSSHVHAPVSECTRAEACARTCVGRALEQFTTAGLLMNEGIRRADVGHEARK